MKSRPFFKYQSSCKRCMNVLWLSLILASCHENDIKPESNLSQEEPKVFLEDDYLVFNDDDLFKKVLYHTDPDLIESKYDEWENIDGFISLNEMLEKAIEEQNNSYGDDWVPFITENEDAFKLGQDGSLDVNMFHSPLRKLVNKNGIIKSGNILYQFTDSNIKIYVGDDVNKLKNTNEENPAIKLYIRSLHGQASSNSRFYSFDLKGEGVGALPYIYNRALVGQVRQKTVLIPSYSFWDDTFIGDVPVTTLYVGLNYYKAKNNKVISEGTKWTVGLTLKAALKLLKGPSFVSFVWDVVAEHWRRQDLEITPADFLHVSYETRIANGYTTVEYVNARQARNSGSLGFYITVPRNNTSEPDGFYLMRGIFRFTSEQRIDGVNRRINFTIEYPGDIKHDGMPQPTGGG